MSQEHLPEHWREKLCVMLSVPGWVTGSFPHQVMRLLTAWAEAEGGWARWDPLNTTDHLSDTFGAWQGVDWNTIGVAQFTTPFHGLVATAATLLESKQFTGIVADMRLAEGEGFTAELIVQRNADEIKRWGTNPTTMLELLTGIS